MGWDKADISIEEDESIADPVQRRKEAIKKKHRRAEFVRITLDTNKQYAKSTGNQSSAWISSIAHADALLYIPADQTGFNEGETVSVLLIPRP